MSILSSNNIFLILKSSASTFMETEKFSKCKIHILDIFYEV